MDGSTGIKVLGGQITPSYTRQAGLRLAELLYQHFTVTVPGSDPEITEEEVETGDNRESNHKE